MALKRLIVHVMPTRKKKCFKKKKKKNENKLPKKRISRPVEIENVVGTSRDVANKSTDLYKSGIDGNNSTGGCSKSGSKSLCSPFNKLPIMNSTRVTEKLKINSFKSNMTYQSPFLPTGLSPKDKCYVIRRCQAKTARYQMLKKQTAEAIKNNKIFTITGSCNAVRKALLDRGWVEKIPANRMNLSKILDNNKDDNEIHKELESLLISNMLERKYPNFVWHTRGEMRNATVDMSEECNVIINRLNVAMWTTKQGLCTTLKGDYWFYIEDVAEVNSPRTYSSYDPGEVEDFASDYNITACTSLLKWVLSMVANERPIFLEKGKVSVNVVVFALNRCKEYLFRKQNKDIDKTLNSVSAGQWNAFLRKYYRIISKEDVFKIDKNIKLELYLVYARFLLQEIHRYRPQLSCEGCHNIWIIKPAYCSRGRGIRLASKYGVITNVFNAASNAKYVIQKYIEEPLLIHDTKFDIRQYYLITNTYPLVIWMYRDCYLKFSSQKYSLENYHEAIHLTNNAVQSKYKNCTGRHPDLPLTNMWDLDTYKSYLIRIERDKVWDKVIYPGMKKSIIGIMLSCQDSLLHCKNRFELYGCDFILDKHYKTWLIEINSNPALSHTTPVTAKICPEVLSDIIKVVVDYVKNPKSSTGKFECVYRQPMSGPRYGIALDLSVRGYTLPPEYFYRGPVPLQKSFDHLPIEKEKDIKATLTKLKLIYDTDLMIQPEGDDDSNLKKEQETCTHITESEQDLQDAAMVINEQLDYLLDRITSEHSLKSANKENALLPTKKSSKSDSCFSSKSATDIKSLLKRSLNRFASSEAINVKRQFFFSKLDDGLQRKASLCDTDSITQTGCKFASNETVSCSENKCDNHRNQNQKFSATKLLKANVASLTETLGKAQNSHTETSSKIRSFLRAKEYIKNKQR